MSSANSKEAKYQLDQLQAALEAESQLRADLEDRLRRSREEFHEFILNAAHELREPLRTVSAYSELLARKGQEGQSDAETDQFRRYILEGAVRVQTLVAGMVECATADSSSRYLSLADMNDVFREAANSLEPSPGQNAAKITRDSLPVVHGDYDKLLKVARHLLDNAARFCGNSEPSAHISSRRQDSDWLFMVRDNGAGIEPAYRTRIFEPFKRLHGRQFAGNGLGLTFCQRVIEAHGGRIWVEAKPGEGSTFCFTLPAHD